MIEKEYQYTKNGYRTYVRYTTRMERRVMDSKMLSKLDKHLKDVDETYFEHMGNALYYTLTFALLTVTTLIHSILPFLFVNTGSKTISKMNKHMTNRLDK